jgi:glycerol-3-phosphate O-acyltransferase
MKKLIMATGLTVVALTGCAYSQQGNTLAAAKIRTTLKPGNQYLNEINVRAMRDFVSRYGDVTDAVWHRSNDNYVAVFYKDSIQHRVIYTSRGDLSYIMKYYEESRMPRDIRAQVKSTYYDYKIYVIQEILTPDHPTIYIVNLQGDTDWKKVKLCQGEMEIMEEFRKGK